MNNGKENFSLVSKIILKSSSSKNEDKNNSQKNYTVFFDLDYYYLILTGDNHNKLGILHNQNSIKEGEEIIFYMRKMPKHIELMKFFERGINCKKESQLNNAINNLDNCFWRVLHKKDLYELKVDDIINVEKKRLILREIHLNEINNEEINITKKKFIMQYESINNKECNICKNNSDENPVIKICECKDKYFHINCLKKNMEKMIEKKEETGFTIFEIKIKTVCDKCKKFIPLNFVVKKEISYEYCELVDIPRNAKENYLIFETLDFVKNNEQNVKYIYFIKLTKKDINSDHEDILIIKDPLKNDEITFFNKIEEERIEKERIDKEKKEKEEKEKIEGKNEEKNDGKEKKDENKQEVNLYPPNILCAIVHDMKKKSLVLKGMGDNTNILVLGNKFMIKQNDKLILESKCINIESYIIKNDQFENIKKEMENNPDKIEERENNKDKEI